MKATLFLCLILIGFTTQAKVERISIYFSDTSLSISDSSTRDLEQFCKKYRDPFKYEIQIIEINSFAEIGDENLAFEICAKRVEMIEELISMASEQPAVRCWGNQINKLNFKPVNWNRVDLYYYIIEINNQANVVSHKVEELQVANIAREPSSTKEVIDYKKDERSQSQSPGLYARPLVLNIEFEAGTFNIKSGQEEELKKLLRILESEPELSAHIMGHVCCENRQHFSKKRAKVIYKFLVENGINKSRLKFSGYGNTSPIIYPEASESDRKTNRRVEVEFYFSSK